MNSLRWIGLAALTASLSIGGLGLTGCSSDTASMPSTGTQSGSLYTRLGGHAGIRSALDKVVAAELADAQIATFFANQMKNPVPAGHPSADQLTECLTNQLGGAAGGPEKYPLTLDASHGSFACGDMASAHAGLKIDDATFDKFVGIAAGELKKLGVADADIKTIGSVLNSTKADVTNK